MEQPFEMRQETALAQITAYSDVAALAPADQDRIARAVSRHVIVGRDTLFAPDSTLSRAELARSLALTGGLPQRIAAHSSFPDLADSDPSEPYVETVAGVKTRHLLMQPP
jgi:hypothetical protein